MPSRVDELLELNVPLALSLHPPNTLKVVIERAIVRWHREGRYGLAFTEVGEEDRAALSRLLADLQAAP